MEWVLIAAALVLGVPGVIMLVGVLSVVGMQNCELEPIELDQDPKLARAHAKHSEWAERNGFEWAGAFRMSAAMNPGTGIACWKLPDAPTYFCVYAIANQVTTDRVTILEHGGVTTGALAGAMLLPYVPGSYVQAFTRASLDQLWERHMEAELFVFERLGAEPTTEDRPIDELITEAVHAQMDHVRTVPLWFLRIPYWYATQSRRTNKPVSERYAHEAA